MLPKSYLKIDAQTKDILEKSLAAYIAAYEQIKLMENETLRYYHLKAIYMHKGLCLYTLRTHNFDIGDQACVLYFKKLVFTYTAYWTATPSDICFEYTNNNETICEVINKRIEIITEILAEN